MSTAESSADQQSRGAAEPDAAPTIFRTPFADAVLPLRRHAPHDEQIVSFHALPWSQGRSLADADPIGERYQLLFGAAYLQPEVAYSGGVPDSYFRPTASLDLAQQLASEFFGADYTFFVGRGTTIANQVAFESLVVAGQRVLEAWSAINTFHPALRPLTALDAARRLARPAHRSHCWSPTRHTSR